MATTPVPRAVALTFSDPPLIAMFPGDGPAITVAAVTSQSRTRLLNKDFSDPSNIIAASGVSIGGTVAQLPHVAASGQVMMFDGVDIVFTDMAPPVGELNTNYGSLSLDNIGSGTGNSALGRQALWNVTDGNNNTVIGHGALRDTDIESNNTAIGHDALAFAIADNCTSVGSRSLYQHVGGDGITAAGYNSFAGFGNRTNSTCAGQRAFAQSVGPCFAVDSTAIGAEAGRNATTYTSVTAFGAGAFFQCPGVTSNAIDSVAGGHFSLSNESTQSTLNEGNVAFGHLSLSDTVATVTGWTAFGTETGLSSTASPCTMFGYKAGRLMNTATGVTACGNYALSQATTIIGTTAIGDSTCALLTTGTGNTCIGSGCDPANGSNNTIIGRDAGVGTATQSNCLIIGTDAWPAGATGDGIFAIGSNNYPLGSTSTAGTSGFASPLPATPQQYLNVVFNGTQLYLPCYAS